MTTPPENDDYFAPSPPAPEPADESGDEADAASLWRHWPYANATFSLLVAPVRAAPERRAEAARLCRRLGEAVAGSEAVYVSLPGMMRALGADAAPDGWLGWCRALAAGADRVVVCRLPGWDDPESAALAALQAARAEGTPVSWLFEDADGELVLVDDDDDDDDPDEAPRDRDGLP